MIKHPAFMQRIGLLAALCYMGAALIYILTGLIVMLDIENVASNGLRIVPFAAVALASTGFCAYRGRERLLHAALLLNPMQSIRRGLWITFLSALLAGGLVTAFVVVTTAINGALFPTLITAAYEYVRSIIPVIIVALPFSIPGSLLFRWLARRGGMNDEE